MSVVVDKQNHEMVKQALAVAGVTYSTFIRRITNKLAEELSTNVQTCKRDVENGLSKYQ